MGGNIRSRPGSIDCITRPLIRSVHRRNSVLDGLNAVVSMVGRGSVGMNYMAKDEIDWDKSPSRY